MECDVQATLDALPATPCSNPAGPSHCYCARGTTKPIAEVDATGAVVGTFCSPGNAKTLLRMGHEIYSYITQVTKVPLVRQNLVLSIKRQFGKQQNLTSDIYKFMTPAKRSIKRTTVVTLFR
jgi:hypothetical protein